MVFFSLLMIASFGALTALTARRRIAASPASATPFEPPFYRGMYAIIAVHIPVLGYFYYAHTDWALGYLVDPLRLPLTFGFVVVSFAFTAYFFFYMGTQTLLRAHRPLTASVAAMQTILASVVYVVLFAEELVHLGTFFEFHTGGAKAMSFDHGLLEVLFGLLLFSVSAGIVLFVNAREDHKYPAVEMEDSKW
jgi:hypothetical protein